MKLFEKDELKKLKQWYSEELKRKDRMIDELREQNSILMKASLKSSEKIAELTERLKKAVKRKQP